MSKPLSANQKTFNKAVTTLLRQNKKSIDENSNTCLYRGPNGTRCGAGALIPNRLYNKNMEGTICCFPNPVAQIIENLGYDTCLARKIQQIHDNYSVHQWKIKFRELAEEEGLVWPAGL